MDIIAKITTRSMAMVNGRPTDHSAHPGYKETPPVTQGVFRSAQRRFPNEWYEAWMDNNRTHLRVETETRGLRGTDPVHIPGTVAGVQAAIEHNPTAVRRHPAGHVIPQNQWDDIARRLGFD